MIRRSTARRLFLTLVPLLALPFLTPCGSISVPVAVVGGAVGLATADDRGSDRPDDPKAAAQTPPLRVVRDDSVARVPLISAPGRSPSALGSAGRTAMKWTLTAATLVDPTIVGLRDDSNSLIETLDSPIIHRSKLRLMDSPTVDLEGYDVRKWQDSKRSSGISRALSTGRARLRVREAGGHEYTALARRIHYHAANGAIVLEGDVTIRCGSQTIIGGPSALAVLDATRRTLRINSAFSTGRTYPYDVVDIPAPP